MLRLIVPSLIPLVWTGRTPANSRNSSGKRRCGKRSCSSTQWKAIWECQPRAATRNIRTARSRMWLNICAHSFMRTDPSISSNARSAAGFSSARQLPSQRTGPTSIFLLKIGGLQRITLISCAPESRSNRTIRTNESAMNTMAANLYVRPRAACFEKLSNGSHAQQAAV